MIQIKDDISQLSRLYMSYILNSMLFSKVGKFIIVGFFGSSLNYSSFYILMTGFNVDYLVAGAIGFLLPVPFVFVLNRNWTFKSKVGYNQGLILYLLLTMAVLSIHSLTQWTVSTLFNVREIHSQLFGIASSAVAHFILAKVFIFNHAV